MYKCFNENDRMCTIILTHENIQFKFFTEIPFQYVCFLQTISYVTEYTHFYEIW